MDVYERRCQEKVCQRKYKEVSEEIERGVRGNIKRCHRN
jgi:hypothetical protein